MLDTQSLNNSLFIGIDVHKYEYTAVAIDRFEEELGVFTFTNAPQEIGEFIHNIEALANQKSLSPIFGIEGSGGNGLFLTKRLLADYTHIYEVNSILTKSRRTYATSWDKLDRIDALLIASLLTRKVNDLPRVSKEYTHNAYSSNLSFIVSSYESLIKEQTMVKNRLHRLLHQKDPLYRNSFTTVFSKRALAYWVRKCKQDAHYGSFIDKVILFQLKELISLTKKLKELRLLMEELVMQSGQHLDTLPGTGIVNAAKLLAYIKDINRFSSIDKFIRYIGCAPESKSSGMTKRFTRARIKNKRLYKTIYGIMLTQLRVVPQAKRYYQKKLSEGKTPRQARRCVIKRIGCIIYGMMKSKGEYRGH